MNSFSECLKQITLLTKKNLQILKMINDSFYTKKNHLVAIVDGEQYVVPSFLSLESKIDNIEANLQNILDAPKTGEAFTFYDGTTQKIELAGYSTTPPSQDLDIPQKFSVATNHIFKDFLSPQPSVRFDLPEIANNIKHVVIKKVAVKDPDLLKLITDHLENVSLDDDDNILSGNLEYGDVVKAVFNYEEGSDYIDYDTVKRLPRRESNPFGEYDIIDITNNWQDSNFEEHYTLQLSNAPVYFTNNGTIMHNILIGDTLVTWNDKIELEVEDTNPVNNSITVKVLHGGYAELATKATGNLDMYRLKYHQVNPEAFGQTKYVEVPLEEDQWICIFVAPLNDTTNTQAPWGTGVFLNTYDLTNDQNQDFWTYYSQNVNNIGDALYALTNMMNDDDQIEKLSRSRFEELQSLQPAIDTEAITVYQINKHLNDSENIKNIRNLYAQKSKYKNELTETQRQIDSVTAKLAETSFDDVEGVRASYNMQLSELNSKKYELNQNITSISQEISENANASDTPIENAKYHIRGFINTELNTDDCKVIGIDVEYRYKNKNKFTGNAETIKETYIYSDWNKMDGFLNTKSPSIVNDHYSYTWDEPNDNLNEPSFNQIDIPITQGENVDIRVRYIYNLGYPMVTFTSAWSDIINIEFPEEFVKNIEILDIIAENNEDIRKNQFKNMLEKEGIIRHNDDRVMDMDQEYFHKSEHIASGFFTPERRVIPLYDQLFTMANTLADLQAEVNGASVQLQITVTDGSSQSDILPNVVNSFRTRSYVTSINEGYYQMMSIVPSLPDVTRQANWSTPVAISNLIVNIYNPSEFPVRLHSMFPGDNDEILTSSSAVSRFDSGNYVGGAYLSNGQRAKSSSNNVYFDNPDSERGVWMLISGEDQSSVSLQHLNQIIYFRTKLANNQPLYALGESDGSGYSFSMQSVKDNNFNGKLPDNLMDASEYNIYELLGELKYAKQSNGSYYAGMASLYPNIGNISDISAPAGSDYLVIDPQSSIQIPLNFIYWIPSSDSIIAVPEGGSIDENDLNSLIADSKIKPYESKLSRAIAFDIRTSMFTEPITYKLVVEAQYQDLQSYKMKTINKKDVQKQYTPVTNSVPNAVNRGKKRR